MLKINELSRLYLGVKGENESRTIEIDMSAWAQIYPNATAVVLHKRNGDQAKELTGATYDSDTKVLSWTTSSYDTFYDGFGVAEIRMVESDVVKKTKDMITTVTASSITNGSGNITESNYQAFLNAVIANKTAAQTAQTAAETAQGKAEDAQAAAEAAVENGPYIDETTGNWMVYDWDDDEYKDTGVHAKGDKGDTGAAGANGINGTDGFSPTATVTKSGSTTTISITDKNGTTTATVNDGADPTTIIDDTAGDGATNKVWSADKSYDEKTTLLSAISAKISEPSSEGTSGQVLTTDGNGGRSWTTVQGGGGTSDYSDLTNKPQINSVTLSGNKSLSDLGIASTGALAEKIDAPSTAGTDGQVLTSDGNGGQTWEDNPSASDIADAVDAWLDENITNPDSPPLDRSLSSSSSAAPADMMGDLMDHESYSEGSGQATVEYNPVTAAETVSGTRVTINGYDNVALSSPTTTDMKIYPVTLGKTYKVIGYSDNTKNRPVLVVADNKATSGTIATSGNYDYQLGTESTAQAQEIEYTALRTGYMYLNTNSSCGLWEKVVTPATERKYYMDEIRNVNIPLITSGLNKSVFREKTDSAPALVKQVPRNAETIAKVTSVADTVTTVRSIISRNLANKNAVDDVVIDGEGTTKTGVKTINLPCGSYYISLGGMGQYTMVKMYEHGVFSSTLYKEQFPMTLGITDPSGGYIVVYASSLANLGDMSTLIIAKLKDGETSVSYEAYSEKTYTPTTLETNPYIQVVPNGFLEFVSSGNTAVSSTVKYLVSGQDDVSTTSKNFIVSPNGTKFFPMVKNDGATAYARVVPKKALFIGNSLTSGWQTFGESATDSDHDFIANFSNYVSTLDDSYTFSRIWATGFEITTTLSAAQTWATNNIDPSLSSDLDLIVVQLGENVTGTSTGSETFAERSAWLLQHLRETCPKARVVWMGLWLNRGWTSTLLASTKETGCEYIDIRPLYLPANVSEIGSLYTMDADYTKSYTVDSFTVSNGQITLVFTVDGVQYTSTITSYTSYTSSSATQISVTGRIHVVDTWYAYMHPGNEGFRKIANKMLFDLGISDSEETITAQS